MCCKSSTTCPPTPALRRPWEPPTGGPRRPSPPRSWPGCDLLAVGGFQDEDRDLAGGLLLVLAVRGDGGHRALPPLRPLLAGELPGDHVHAVRAVLELDGRVRPEVVVPVGMLRGTALGRHRRIPAVMLDPHQRGLAHLAAADPAIGDDHHRQAGVTQRRALGPAGTLVQLDLVPDPGGRARLVLFLDWHSA